MNTDGRMPNPQSEIQGSHKRMRTPPTASSPPGDQPTPKALRTILPRTSPHSSTPSSNTTQPPKTQLFCTLPPTCHPPHHRATALANTQELERHYATYHAHVCEVRGCGCVFPDARLLELHQTENHDPIAAVRKDRGEKIFACHVGSCPKLFSSPKGRRLHLIEGHGYPKEYFFAVTNKGVGGLLKKWGEGVSLVRGPWKARDRGEEEYDDEDSHAQEERASGDSGSASGGMDEIADAMNAMTLVPPAIRFGRGGKRGGFRHGDADGEIDGRGRGRGRGGAARRGGRAIGRLVSARGGRVR